MAVLIGLLVLIQAAGALIGLVGAVVGELSYLKAMQDQRIDHAEREHLRAIARALRAGMLLVLAGSIGLVAIDYAIGAPAQPAFTSAYWVLMTLVLVIIAVSWALSRKQVAFWLGSAATFTAWWMVALLAFGQLPALGYGAALALYLIATAVMAGILSYARMLTAIPNH